MTALGLKILRTHGAPCLAQHWHGHSAEDPTYKRTNRFRRGGYGGERGKGTLRVKKHLGFLPDRPSPVVWMTLPGDLELQCAYGVQSKVFS